MPQQTDQSMDANASRSASLKLKELLSDYSDVRLKFDDGQTVPGHSQILQQWSGVLRTAIEASSTAIEASSGGKPFSNAHPLTIPLPGTTKQQWLAAAAFMYPLFPRAAVSWDNLEALLVIGSKYDCAVLLLEAQEFIKSHTSDLMLEQNVSNTPNTSAWNLIHLTDSLGLAEAAQGCIDAMAKRDHKSFADSCVGEGRLSGLTPQTLQHIVVTLARAGGFLDRGMAYCSNCRAARRFYAKPSHGHRPTCSQCNTIFGT